MILPRLFTLLLMASVVACESNDSPLPLVGTLERDRLEVVAEANERIIEVLVTEGDRVEAGQVLMRLEPELYRAQIEEAQALRSRAEQRLAELVRGPREEEIREAQARLTGARENRTVQRREFIRIEGLVEKALASPSDLDQAYNSLEAAKASVDEYAAVLDRLLDGTTREELAQAQADLDREEASLQRLELIAARLQIRAPRAGIIDSVPYRLGERPAIGTPVIVMLAGDMAPFARIYIPEPLRARIRPGVAADIRIDGIETLFHGRVRYIANDATFTPYYSLTQRDRSRLAFLSEVTLTDETAADLPNGVPVEVDFPSLR